MLPDISDFTLLGSELKQGQDCQKWQKKEVIGQKVSKPLPDCSEFEQSKLLSDWLKLDRINNFLLLLICFLNFLNNFKRFNKEFDQ